MMNLVQGILDYSLSSSELEKEPLNLHSIINEVMEIDQLTSRATVKFECELPSVDFNKPVMIQVMRNLLGNAVKYSDKEVCNISIKYEDSDQHTIISISDNGPGIAKENQEKIFELFNKIDADAKIDSHGIGLATVKSVLEAAGEKIWITSEVGEGATFHFTIHHT
jgi:signal transduction histidine kinase